MNKACIFCQGQNFHGHVSFKVTSNIYKHCSFTYARCNNCNSILKISEDELNYDNYEIKKEISDTKALRFIKFLKKHNVSEEEFILDYGCGFGALVRGLQRHSFHNVSGYEPYSKEYKNFETSNRKFSTVYLTHVFEHIQNYNEFFGNLSKITKPGSKIITIHPSSSRLYNLNPTSPFHVWTIHAPYHLVIPSDKAVVNMFSSFGYRLIKFVPYDVQRSGIKDNNNVSSLLFHSLGSTRENFSQVSRSQKMVAALKSPISFFKYMFVNTKDNLVSTFLFERKV